MVAQAAAAMMRSVDADRTLHSMHSYFMRPVDIGSSVRYEVERLRDGRGYSTRTVRGFQNGKPVYAAMGSFQVPEDGPDFQPEAPAAVEPESLRTAAEALDGTDGPAADYWSTGRSFDMRHIPGPVYIELEGGSVPQQAFGSKPLTPCLTTPTSTARPWPTSAITPFWSRCSGSTDSTGPARDSPPPALTTPCGSTATAAPTNGSSMPRKPSPARATGAWPWAASSTGKEGSLPPSPKRA